MTEQTNTEKTYSLAEAVQMTGFSRNKFHYNREVLEDYGVVVTSNGWKIPHSVLVKLGWLGVKAPKPRRSNITIKQWEEAQAEITRLTSEVERLNLELNNKRWSLFRKR